MDRSADGIGVADIAAHRLLKVLPSGVDPEQFVVSADGSKMYIANEDAAEASVLDLSTGSIRKSIKVGEEPDGVTQTGRPPGPR